MVARRASAGEPQVSVVIPVLNDAQALSGLLSWLCRAGGKRLEIIVADGGSGDGSTEVAYAHGCRVVASRPGRGHQLAAGLTAAHAPWIWMLHADCEPSTEALRHLLSRPPGAPGWGRFSVSLAPGTALEVVARAMNWRSRLTGICTGDQGIFVHRALLQRLGGMPRQSLMEDIELTRRLKRCCRPDCRREPIATSPRRWQRCGAVRTVLSMWRLRLRYWLGADPEALAAEYYGR
jgi:rSAM/selenodomain-associated transferase 2